MLTIKNITYKYKNSDFFIHIDNAEFKPHRITCFLGENGSGKTTLLNVLAGHLAPQKNGGIKIFDEDYTNASAQERPIATVFQELGLFPHLTISENLVLAIEPNRLFGKSESTERKVDEVIKTFHLEEFKGKKPHSLSGGQKQRVAIARAICTSPKVLLLDEPTSSLDYQNIAKLKKLLQTLKSSNEVPMIIIVSHDWHFVMDIADDIFYIENGSLKFSGTKENFKNTDLYNDKF